MHRYMHLQPRPRHAAVARTWRVLAHDLETLDTLAISAQGGPQSKLHRARSSASTYQQGDMRPCYEYDTTGLEPRTRKFGRAGRPGGRRPRARPSFLAVHVRSRHTRNPLSSVHYKG